MLNSFDAHYIAAYTMRFRSCKCFFYSSRSFVKLKYYSIVIYLPNITFFTEGGGADITETFLNKKK